MISSICTHPTQRGFPDKMHPQLKHVLIKFQLYFFFVTDLKCITFALSEEWMCKNVLHGIYTLYIMHVVHEYREKKIWGRKENMNGTFCTSL